MIRRPSADLATRIAAEATYVKRIDPDAGVSYDQMEVIAIQRTRRHDAAEPVSPLRKPSGTVKELSFSWPISKPIA
jgi:hypothetical protein